MADDPSALLRDLSQRVTILEGRVASHDAVVAEQVAGIRDDLDRLERAVADAPSRFVSLERYLPVERATFGVIGAVLLTVVGAVLALVIRGAA